MEQLIPYLISLVSGGAGGNLAGALVKGLGGGFKTIVGALGGLVGGQWLGPLLDIAGKLGNATGGNIASSAGAGAIITALIGMFFRKKS